MATPARFRIHHLSDLHIGPLHYQPDRKLSFVTDTSDIPACATTYLSYISDDRNLPDLVVISGDFTSYADDSEFECAKAILETIEERLQSRDNIPRVCIVPGNHDLDWSAEVQEDRIKKYKSFASYFRFIAASPCGTKDQHLVFPEQRIIVTPFDSCYYGGVVNESQRELADRLREQIETLRSTKRSASTTAKDLAEAVAYLESDMRKDPGYIADYQLEKGYLPDLDGKYFGIAVVHHNPAVVNSGDVEEFEVIVNSAKFKRFLQESGYSLVLHGHRHFQQCAFERLQLPKDAEQQQELMIVSADSWGCTREGAWQEIEVGFAESGAAAVSVRSAELSGSKYQLHDLPSFNARLKYNAHATEQEIASGRYEFYGGGAKGASGYLPLLANTRQSIHVTHLDGDGPSEKVMGEYHRLLDKKGFEFQRLIFLQKPLNKERYGWVHEFETNEDGTTRAFNGVFTQYAVEPLPKDADLANFCEAVSQHLSDGEGKVADAIHSEELDALRVALVAMRPMLMSFAVFDKGHDSAVTAISLLRSPDDKPGNKNFEDLLVIWGKDVADEFYTIFSELLEKFVPRKLTNPLELQLSDV